MQPYLFRVSDYGRDWENLITENISGYALSALQDPLDPNLLFLGTEFGLFVSTNGGDDWFKFTAGVPTASVMDMAIQQRENDLVLGTHGRSIYILDDYSALRGLEEDDFDDRLAILAATPGQQYVARQTPSTRFTGSGEFRARNEPYGAMVTFVASGQDLPHPDQERERERLARQRAAGESGADGDAGPELVKVEMTVRDASGTVVRRQKFGVHQGVNRIVWGMEHDGVRPLPGGEPVPIEDGLPDGPEVPPGEYEMTLSMPGPDGATVSAVTSVELLPDPRASYTPEDRIQNYRTLLELQAMQKAAVTAVERIVRSRGDIDTVLSLIDQRKQPGVELDASLTALQEQAGELKDRLVELEKRFRTPPKTKGIVYDEDKVVNRIGLAMFYVGSSRDAPTPTAAAYTDLARVSLEQAQAAVDSFTGTDLAAFAEAVSAAGIGLFGGSTEP